MRLDKSIYVVDEIGAVVSRVSSALTPALQAYDPRITGVHYLHGHPLEIIDTLRQRDQSRTLKFDKYPLVALFQDFPEICNTTPGIAFKVRLHLIIARATLATYKSGERYDYNFKPVLYPIYRQLMLQLAKHKMFLNYGGPDVIPHVKIDRVFWGAEGLYTDTKNIFDDMLDCIEIKNLELNVYSKFC